ncbi:hypothetical protein SAMN05421788_110218 [Filimonas lacunae]|uniref:Uncharacterized protein n=1 Tax=Filimonas lacunae TaxID=477680 RepID=A0A173MAA2_9BACT|nr:hypothetical protein [Filimonas lacunae]BAV04483.1 hypothetical protein FLA_0475 [Filimonas lacunae]SIT31545.1 hypothetical protein SAMN05421788_110218 [Filimonas lacunae]
MKTSYFAAVVLLLVMVSATFTSKANVLSGKEKEETTISEKQVTVQYAGNEDNGVVFRVAFDNPTAQKFTLIIKNDAGDVLYNGQFNDAHFSKAIHLLKDDSEMNPVFVIRSGNQKIENAFKVSINADLADGVVVTKQ